MRINSDRLEHAVAPDSTRDSGGAPPTGAWDGACCRALATVVASGALLVGCATIDHQPDVDRAAELVGDRAGLAPEWTAPWDVEHPLWDGTGALSSDDAVRVALVNNRELRADLERIAIARADLVQAGLLPNPILSIALGFPIDGGGGTTTVGAGVTQQLVALWLRDDRVRLADAELNATILGVSDRALTLVRDVRRAHASVHFAERSLELVRDDEAILDRLVSLMQARSDAGEASTLDVNRILLKRRFAGAERIEAERDLTQRRLELLTLIGRAAAPLDWSVEPPPKDAPGDRPMLDEPTLVALVDAQRLDVIAARAAVEAREMAIDVEDRQRLLRGVGVGADFERDEDGRQWLGPSLSVEVPIFDTNDATVARAVAEWRQAAIDADRVRELAIAEVRAAHADLIRHDQMRRWCADELIPAADAQLELVRRVIDAGEIDATVLLETQREGNQARRRLNDATRDATLRRFDLERAVGGRLPDAPAGGAEHASAAEPVGGAE